MDCTLILYAARKTSLCERTLAKSLQPLSLRIRETVFSTSAKALGEQLRQAFLHDDICFVVGGMSFSDSREVRAILASAAASSHPELVRRLKNPSGEEGLLLRCGSQLLILLPDEPDAIADMLKGILGTYLKTCNH